MKRYPADDQAPLHPGTILRQEVLPALGLNVSQAAQEMKIARQTLHRIMAGQAAITPDMALRIAKLSATRPEAWLNRQLRHDLWRAKQNLASVLATISAHPAKRPESTRAKAHCA